MPEFGRTRFLNGLAEKTYPGVVDEDVDAAETLGAVSEHRPDVVLVANVARDRLDLSQRQEPFSSIFDVVAAATAD